MPSPAWTVLDGWSEGLAPRLGLSWRVLRAYGWTEKVLRQRDPSCGLTWPTLAGIGWVESRNGTGESRRAGGPSSVVGGDDVVRPTILGPVLDGAAGRPAVRSTDGGRLDGDTRWDRAVGPLQFLPSTWAVYGVGLSGRGPGDPSNIDDAAMAAGRFLCAAGALGTGSGWEAAVVAYNHSTVYATEVAAAARWYAERSLDG